MCTPKLPGKSPLQADQQAGLHSLQNIILIGPMGSGKTTLGRRLAPLMGRTFIDLDEELERRCGVEVAVVFDIEGEAGFRKREKELLNELVQRRDQVLATGGGSILDEDNRLQMKRNGLIVWLNTSVDQQIQRLERDRRRPLLAAPDRRQRLTEMAELRNPIYQSLADVEFSSRNLPLTRMVRALHQTLLPYVSEQGSSACP
ncbi:MAG: shikimate kinase [Pseudomonadota bacterium]